MKNKQAVYFVSDFHLGTPGNLDSKERERKIVRFLDKIANDASHIYLLGDVFDFWFEYKTVVPRGYVRLFGKLAELKDKGIDIQFFKGNHDMWVYNYFQEEFGIPVHSQTISVKHFGKDLILGHGDGLGPGDRSYKLIKAIFSNKILQSMFGALHPNIGLGIMRAFSRKSRKSNPDEKQFFGKDKERLLIYAEEEAVKTKADYFIFGHRHLPIDMTLSNQKSKYVNLGDWLNHYSYARLDETGLSLLFFENKDGKIFT